MKKEAASLKEVIKSKSAEKRELTLKILVLKWGSLTNARRARELRKPLPSSNGGAKQANTRAERKALRHPETGPERSALWADKRDSKNQLRYLYLAYAFVRGRSYKQAESKCAEAPSAHSIASTIQCEGGTATVEEVQSWLERHPLPWQPSEDAMVDLALDLPAHRTGTAPACPARLFVVTRDDLSAGQQAVQLGHALKEFGVLFPEEDRRWYDSSNTLVYKAVQNEPALLDLLTRAREQEIKVAVFREPDRQNEMTAIALEPGVRTETLCKGLPLALRRR